MAIFNVDKSTDNGKGNEPGSLSWAIKQANTNAGADTIDLDTNVRLALLPDLKRMQTLINSDVTLKGDSFAISGNNDDDSTIDINGEDRPLLFIKSGTVTLENLTLTNGVAKGGNGGGGGAGMGGALFIYDGNVTVNNVAFTNNRAIGGNGGFSGAGGGAAVFVRGGSLTLNNATFSNNQAQGGLGRDIVMVVKA